MRLRGNSDISTSAAWDPWGSLITAYRESIQDQVRSLGRQTCSEAAKKK